MNLMEEGFQNREEKSKNITSKIILAVIIVLVILIIAIISYIYYIQNTTLKVILDGQVNEKLKQLLKEEDGTVYFPIKEVANYFGYDSYNGEYSDKSEEASKCYIQSENEVANFTLGSNKIYKVDLTSSTENYEYKYAKKPVKAREGVLYATSEMIEQAFNISFQYDKEKNRIYIYTLPYLVETYSTKVLDYGYTEISDALANRKAILQNMLVVKKDNSKFAVIDLQGNTILEAKYDNITYLPNIGDFLVTANKKVGILSKSKETKIQIMYDSIELMDSDAGLYVVKKDNKYGVLDLKGNIKIDIKNDEIGMDVSKFEQNNIKSKYILAENLIPIRKDSAWGLYDKNGNQVVDFEYDNFGYVASSNKDALNLLVIPDYNVIVACKNKKYTLLSSEGEELFAAPVADDIYMTISGGEKHYYIVANNGKMDAEEYLDKIGVTANNTSNNTSINSTSSNNTNTSKEFNSNKTLDNTTNENQESSNGQQSYNDESQQDDDEEQQNNDE